MLPRAYLKDAWEFTRERNLALHVDGARIFNAIVAYGCELKDVTQYCDSFTICLSKGLGTPVGSLLVGSHEYIKRAIRWRKMTGGGMRQAGVGEEHAAALGEYMKAQGVLINASPIVRLVMHLDVSREQLAEVVAHWRAFLTQ